MKTRRQKSAAAAPGLADLGAPLRTINSKPQHPTPLMRGSRGLPTLPAKRPAEPSGPRVVRFTQGPSYTHDPRFQCAPGESVPKHFGAYLPGIDPSTGGPWA